MKKENKKGAQQIKKADPATETAPQNVQADSTAIYPTQPRETRCLKAIAKSGRKGIFRYALDDAMGAQNSPEYVSRLRATGWEISTERVPVVDRDGRTIRIGLYRLALGQVDAALCMKQVQANG